MNSEWIIESLQAKVDAKTSYIIELESKNKELLNMWINKSKEVPKEDGYYLFRNNGCLPFVAFYRQNYGVVVDGELCRATHWMKLPELPKNQ